MRALSMCLLGGSLLLTGCPPTNRPGECADSPSCGTMCIRAVSCVAECGGPATNCGCCGCADGFIDTAECS